MKYNLLVLVTIPFFVNACSAPNSTALNELTPAPTIQNATASAPTSIPVVSTRTDRRAPTLAPPATATAIPTATSLPSNTATAVSSPTRTRPNASPLPTLAPAVYVTAFSIEPPTPKSKPARFLFHVQFLNTVGQVVNYPRWRVLIIPKGQTKAVGDPQGASRQIANGASEQNTEAWSIRVTSACESFTAQPVWEDPDARQSPFPKPDGKNILLEFQVCP